MSRGVPSSQPSFPRRRESTATLAWADKWTPAFAAVTGEGAGVRDKTAVEGVR